MTKTARQLDREITEALRGRARARPVRRAHASKKTDADVNDLDEALRHYAKLSEAATRKSPGPTPEAWDSVAARIEAGVEAAGLKGDFRTFAMARARDARSNAQVLRLFRGSSSPSSSRQHATRRSTRG